MNEPRFHDDAARNRYQLLVGDDEVGYIEYDRVGTTSILIKHTEVRQGHEGKGYGSRLVQSAFDRIRDEGRTAIPICPYALSWVRKHPAYHSVVREDLRKSL
jgi:predicted GNAT family acetyltransferase